MQGHETLLSQRLVALFAAALALFNFPLLALWDGGRVVLGLPLFPVALFGLWILLIGALAWLMESPGD
jgi:fatty acid desaturase